MLDLEPPEAVVEHDPIVLALRAELRDAQERRDAASKQFDDALQTPSGIPYPDNVARIQQASAEYTFTQREVLDVLKRTNFRLCRRRGLSPMASCNSSI